MMNQEEMNNITKRTKIQESNINNISNQMTRESKEENRQQTQNNMPEVLTNPIYTPGFLRGQIGKLMRVEFLIGTNNMVDRIGFLEDVGASYILLKSFEGDSIIYADIYSIKFITISSTFGSNNNYQNYNNISMNNGMNYNMNRYY